MNVIPTDSVAPEAAVSSSTRIRLWVGVVSALALLMAAAFLLRPAPYSLLYGGLFETDAAWVIEALTKLEVPHKSAENGSAIYVPAAKVHWTRLQIAAEMTRQRPSLPVQVIDRTQSESDSGPALEHELAATISHLPEVAHAKIQIEKPDNRSLLAGEGRSSALVNYHPSIDTPLPGDTAKTIRSLIANATGIRETDIFLEPSPTDQGAAAVASSSTMLRWAGLAIGFLLFLTPTLVAIFRSGVVSGPQGSGPALTTTQDDTAQVIQALTNP